MGKYGKKSSSLKELSEEDQVRYQEARIFEDNEEFEVDKSIEPVIVEMSDEKISLSEDEEALLALGPKFCVVRNLREEQFECDVEEAIMKYRWEIMGKEKEKNRKKEDHEIAFNVLLSEIYSEEEVKAMEEEERILEAETRMIFHPESGRFDYSKRRATDQKGNSRVTFPKGSKDFEIEAKIQTFRTEAIALFRKHVAKKCGKFSKKY